MASSQSRSFLKSSMIYFVGNVMSKLVSFVLLPIFTKLIAKDEMGYYDYTTTMVVFFATVIFFNIWAGILRFMFDEGKMQDRIKVVSNGLVVFSFSLLLYSIATLGLWISMPYNHALLIFLFGATTMLHYVYGNICRGYGQSKLYAASGVTASFVSFAVNLTLLYLTPLRIETMFISVILGYLVQIVWIELRVGVVRSFMYSQIDISQIRSLIRFCIPLSIGSVSSWFLNGYGRYVLTNTQGLGLEATGLFAVAGRFSALLSLISSSFILAWQEIAFSQDEKEKDKENSIYNRAIQGYSAFLTIGVTLLLPIIGVFFPWLINVKYSESYWIVPFLFTGTAIGVFVEFYSQVFVALKRTKLTMIVYAAGAVCNVVFIHVFLSYLKVQSVGVALLISNSVMIIIQTVLVNRITNIKLISRHFLIGICTVIGSIIVYLFGNRIIMIAYGFVCFVFFTLIQKERWKPLLLKLTRKR